ncbi:signal recognition particle-docking protein FtsY [Desulfonatronovibrio hydrogenovorans]|uniref:signal recognition particle-docking protein FtsY n=1 Tax=Desulfonatronovibrio hydrogenovorans TaxID=53245 RepID=UPI00048A6D61|nr:signal recognition particle-docking protein FtsY [Desulfonatronovibrio hydrogenovorans]
MGFFSKIKKFWKTEKPDQDPAKHLDSEKEQSPDLDHPDWQGALRRSLSLAEPKLSIWLECLLDGVDKKGDLLWDRLLFLFKVLETPEHEADKFVASFSAWLDDMGYVHLDEFKSELQYRLALALDLEDEEDERDRLFLKLSQGLTKTKEQLSHRVDMLLSSTTSFDDAFWEELEEILIMADVGYQATSELLDKLRPQVRGVDPEDRDRFKELFMQELAGIFPVPPKRIPPDPPEIILVIGVNGVGKTTTIAKLAYRSKMKGRKVMIVAGDTFRAAAIEQLSIWSKRTGAGFFAKDRGSDPASVAYEAMDKARAEGYDQVLVDTAGRLHTKVDLMQELKKIKNVIAKKCPGAPHKTILVLDATTGQNALSQTELFGREVRIDEIIMTKLDGTAKGGVVAAIALQHQIPITYIGLGEKMEDLRPFDGQSFAKALLG